MRWWRYASGWFEHVLMQRRDRGRSSTVSLSAVQPDSAYQEKLKRSRDVAFGQASTLEEDKGGADPPAITEQIDPGMLHDGESSSEEDYFWWQPGTLPAQKDFSLPTYLERHQQAYEAYHTNPLAFSIIEITTSFVLGKGITIDAAHRGVQRILMNFWNDPNNNMDERIYQICTELALYGEIFVRFFVNPYDGTVNIRLIDPSLIDEIKTDPEDIERPLRFHRRSLTMLPDEGEWYEAGEEMMQFAVNKVSNAKRGNSDLATLLPWLRRYKDWLTDRVLINRYKGAFLYDVTLRGADKKTIERKKMEYSCPPEPGSILIHNELEQWAAVQPQIQAGDVQEDGRALKLMVAAGAGLPEHYLADSSRGNRATAAEMAMPTLLRFQRRQRVLKRILRSMLDRVIVEARRAGKIGKHIDTSYEVSFPEIDVDDNAQLANAVESLVNALVAARQQGWVSDETAMRLLFKFAGEETDVHAEMARIKSGQRAKQGAL